MENSKSNYEFIKPMSVVEQVRILKNLFPDELGEKVFDEDIATNLISIGAGRCFAIPKWQLFGKNYYEACEKVLRALSNSRNGKFRNKIIIDTENLRESKEKISGLKKNADAQKGNDILVISGQLTDNELRLGIFETAIILIAHYKNIYKYNNLKIDCAGDESTCFGGAFFNMPEFSIVGDELWLSDYSKFYAF